MNSNSKHKVWGVWFGGSSYGGADNHDDVEVFNSIEAAKNALADRERSNGQRRVHFEYVNKPPVDVTCPVVGTDSELWLWTGDWSDDDGDVQPPDYPDYVVRFGPRGGVRAEVA